MRMHMRAALGLVALLATFLSARAGTLPAAALKERPKLVLVLVIDQFRADYLTRFHHRFLPPVQGESLGGFRYLMERGAYFPNGQYDLLQDMTAPGHATVLTGAYPYQAGIPLNYWYDAKTRARVYSAEDPAVATVGSLPKDPHAGTSPRYLLGSTVGDELKSIGRPARVVSLALKDRAAILMGGHQADLALWMDADATRWISSRFYLPKGELPAWVRDLNRSLVDQTRAVASEKGYGHHLFESADGLEATETAAERAIAAYHLGAGKTTDLLAVSFSSHDYVGHDHGPTAPIMETMTVTEDKLLAKLFNYVRRHVPGGMKNVVIVLTADHGIVHETEGLRERHTPAGHIDEKRLAARIEARLEKKFGRTREKWIPHIETLNVYLDPAAISERGADRQAVENEVKAALLEEPGVAHAFTLSDYRARRLPPGQFERQILKTYYPGRSGDVIAIPRPNFIVGSVKVNHISGYNYDRTVPILFAGGRVKAGVHPEEAQVVDIAPTLSFLLGTIPPSLSEGRVLAQIF